MLLPHRLSQLSPGTQGGTEIQWQAANRGGYNHRLLQEIASLNLTVSLISRVVTCLACPIAFSLSVEFLA